MKICIICETRKTPKTGKLKDGSPKYASYCTKCKHDKYRNRDWITKHSKRAQNLQFEKDALCSRCNFIPEDVCQLDIDHIVRKDEGGQHIKENTQTLCANCHRLKTACEARGVDLPTFVYTV